MGVLKPSAFADLPRAPNGAPTPALTGKKDHIAIPPSTRTTCPVI